MGSPSDSNVASKLKRIATYLWVIALSAGCLWYTFVRVTNEIGPLGFDKAGRQILIQSMNAVLRESPAAGVTVDSEWASVPLLARFVQEPMRTTLRYNYHAPSKPDYTTNRAQIESYLQKPCDDFLAPLTELSMRGDQETETTKEIAHRLRAMGGTTTGDLLAGLGFHRIEVYVNGRRIASIPLRLSGHQNVLCSGTD